VAQYFKKEKNRGRLEKRTVKVYANKLNAKNKKKWTSVQSIIEVKREIVNKGTLSKETAYFISDLKPETGAKYFYEGIRSHWRIETFHYVKDKIFLEDAWKVRTKNAAVNYSLIRNLAINIFRQHRFNCIQAAIEKCANNVEFMMSLL
jgi:predicted transposase YbfD/YdcC